MSDAVAEYPARTLLIKIEEFIQAGVTSLALNIEEGIIQFTSSIPADETLTT